MYMCICIYIYMCAQTLVISYDAGISHIMSSYKTTLYHTASRDDMSHWGWGHMAQHINTHDARAHMPAICTCVTRCRPFTAYMHNCCYM